MENEFNYRLSLVSLLEILASEKQQLLYEAQVPYVDITAELVCMWFDDSYNQELVEQHFNPSEIKVIKEFHQYYKERVDLLPDSQGTVETWLANPVWCKVMDKAQETLAKISTDLKKAIINISNQEQNGEFQSDEAKGQLAEIAQSLSLDLEREKKIRDKGKLSGKDILSWVRVPKATYPVMELLQSLPFFQMEELICWMLERDDDVRWIGAGCYRLLKTKTVSLYSACLDAGLSELDPSANRSFIESCCKHKGSLSVYQDLFQTITNKYMTDAKRAGALNAVYWTGIDSWPTISEYDKYITNPKEVIERSVEKISQFFSEEIRLGNLSKEDVREIASNGYERYPSFKKDDLELKELLYRKIVNCCVGLFLDETKLLSLRKLAYIYIPFSEFFQKDNPSNLLSKENLEKDILVIKAAQTFPDEYVQSRLKEALELRDRLQDKSRQTPGTWKHRLRLLYLKLLKILFSPLNGRS